MKPQAGDVSRQSRHQVLVTARCSFQNHEELRRIYRHCRMGLWRPVYARRDVICWGTFRSHARRARLRYMCLLPSVQNSTQLCPESKRFCAVDFEVRNRYMFHQTFTYLIYISIIHHLTFNIKSCLENTHNLSVFRINSGSEAPRLAMDEHRR